MKTILNIADLHGNAADVAAMIGLTPRRVQQLVREGVIPRAARGRYPLAAACAAYVAWLQGRLQEGGQTDLASARTRLALAQAEKTELEAAELRGDLIGRADVGEHWLSMAVAMRTRLLAIPSGCTAAICALQSDPVAVRNELTNAIHEALRELSDNGLPRPKR